MKANRSAQSPRGVKPAKSLTKVLKQSEHVKDLVEECAVELASVNTALQDELADGKRLPEVEQALQQSEAVEIKVQEASVKLAEVNQALEDEVKGRQVLENQLAAVREQEEASRYASLHDPLTGLPNRALFDDRLEHGLAQANRHGWMLAVMFMDLDDFKSINDQHGHDVGDIVLQTLADRLKDKTRSDDTISRHGGDEFMYLLMEIRGDDDATIIAEKLVRIIQAPIDVGAIQLTVSASLGIALFPKNGDTAEALITTADAAMYRAKRSKSGYAFAS